MKKILTLLIAVSSFGVSFAQSRTVNRAKDIIKKDPNPTVYGDKGTRYPTSTGSSTSRNQEINDINRYYDAKIQAVRSNPLLSAAEKEKRIRALEYERAQKIREINNRYYGNNNTTTSSRSKGYGKSDNPGKHLGWEKGKGNPHRTGQWKGEGKGHGKDHD